MCLFSHFELLGTKKLALWVDIIGLLLSWNHVFEIIRPEPLLDKEFFISNVYDDATRLLYFKLGPWGFLDDFSSWMILWMDLTDSLSGVNLGS